MWKKKNRSFTILEMIIVIIILAVLSTLALPRFMRGIERSRGMEALANISSIRRSIERCYQMSGGNYSACLGPGVTNWGLLGMDNPAAAPNAHFLYVATLCVSSTHVVISAVRNNHEYTEAEPGINYNLNCGSNCGTQGPRSFIEYCHNYATDEYTIDGVGFYEGM